MTKHAAINWSMGVLAGAAIGAGAWLLIRRGTEKSLVEKLENMADEARETTGGWARTLRDKACPVIDAIGDLVETNAELVSAFANVSAEQVRKTGQEIKHAAPALEKTLDALAHI